MANPHPMQGLGQALGQGASMPRFRAAGSCGA